MAPRKKSVPEKTPAGRKTLKEALDSALDPELLEGLIREALQARKEVAVDCEFKCKSCGKAQRPRIKVPFRDWAALKGFLQLAIEHSQGRAPTAPALKKALKVSGDFNDLTDEQLEALANQEIEDQEVSDGEADGSAAEEAA